MNKKYYLFLMLLFCGVGAVFQVNAKPPKQNPANNQSQTNNVDSTKIEDEEVSRPKINQIRFSGNTTISSEILIKAIPLKTKDIANENTIMNSMIKIAQIYKTKNIKVTITPIIEKVSTKFTNIQFDIHETPIQEK